MVIGIDGQGEKVLVYKKGPTFTLGSLYYLCDLSENGKLDTIIIDCILWSSF